MGYRSRAVLYPLFRERKVRMKGTTFVQRMAVWLAVVGCCLPQVALAARPSNNQKPVIADVQLQEGGVLLGQVVTPQNTAVAATDVVLLSGKKQLAVGKTDKQGYFAFSRLPRGVYQVAAAKGYGAYRVWTPKTAPPSARKGALIVAGTNTVRGQNGIASFRNFLANPIVIAGIVATAIAVPVAIHNSNRSKGTP